MSLETAVAIGTAIAPLCGATYRVARNEAHKRGDANFVWFMRFQIMGITVRAKRERQLTTT
jgi:hypothetical protein